MPAARSARSQSAWAAARGDGAGHRVAVGAPVFHLSAVLAVLATSWLLLSGGAARAAGDGACRVPAGARLVVSVAGVRVWSQTVRSPASARQRYGRASYPAYSDCAPGHAPQVLFRDYSGDEVAARVAGDYVGLLDKGGMESLYLSDVLTGRTTSTTSFTPSVQDNGGSEAFEPGPLIAWRVSPGGWLVYLDTLSDGEGSATALVAFTYSGGTTLDLAANSSTGAREIGGLLVRGRTVSWRSGFSGTHRVRLGRTLLPAALPKPLPSACALVPRSLARRLLGPLSTTTPPSPRVPPAGFHPAVRTGTDRSGCAYAAAADSSQTLAVTEQRVAPRVVSRQQRAINSDPRDDNTLALAGIAAVLHSKIGWRGFPPSGPEDMRLFINGIEVDVTTNSARAAGEIKVAGLAVERALHDALPS